MDASHFAYQPVSSSFFIFKASQLESPSVSNGLHHCQFIEKPSISQIQMTMIHQRATVSMDQHMDFSWISRIFTFCNNSRFCFYVGRMLRGNLDKSIQHIPVSTPQMLCCQWHVQTDGQIDGENEWEREIRKRVREKEIEGMRWILCGRERER